MKARKKTATRQRATATKVLPPAPHKRASDGRVVLPSGAVLPTSRVHPGVRVPRTAGPSTTGCAADRRIRILRPDDSVFLEFELRA
jgi:hypothetical protein